ncbi:MAG: hypothetical protein QXK24_08395, partial [Ignisphaera sp.]
YPHSLIGSGLLSDNVLSSWSSYTIASSADVIRGIVLRSAGGVWVINTNGYGYYVPNTYTNLGSTGMKYTIPMANYVRDMILTIDASDNLYLFVNGTFYSVDVTFMGVYPFDSFHPNSNPFYAVKIGNYIYVGWSEGYYYGVCKIDINLKKVVWNSYVIHGGIFPSQAPRCIGFDGDAETLFFIYFKNGVFYYYNINGDNGGLNINYYNSLLIGWYVHGVMWQASSLGAGSYTANIYRTNAVGNLPILDVNYYVNYVLTVPHIPICTGDTIHVNGSLYRNGIPVNKHGAIIYLNNSYIDNIATVNKFWLWNYTIPPFYGYSVKINLVLTFIPYDFEFSPPRRLDAKTITLTVNNNVSIPPSTWVISGYVFEVNLLTPTIEWVTNYTYTFHVKFAQVYNTSLMPTNGTVLTFLNNAIIKQLSFKDIVETQINIMFNRSGYYTLQFNAYNSSNALVGRKVWYINITGQPALPPAPSQPVPVPSVIDVIGVNTFSNLLIVLLLLLTPIFIFARLGSAGIIVGGIIGLILCYIAGLIQLWMLVLAGIGILAIIFFGGKGG